MLVCWPVGFGVGAAAQHVVEDHIHQHKLRFPMPPDDVESDAVKDRSAEHAPPRQAPGNKAA